MDVDPVSAGMSAERLSRITRYFQEQYFNTGKISGCQILVSRKGVPAYFKSLGKADIERAVEVPDGLLTPGDLVVP